LLRQRRGQVSGILNGLDYAEWNPATDARLAATYTAATLRRRAINKRAVQDQLGLKRKPRTPLIGLVTRLYDQKGFDLIVAAADRLFERDVQLVVLGSGDEKYHTALAELKARYPGRVGVEHNFNEPLARLIYGGSDLFLMPSHFEPCGLGQLIAMRYGSVPVRRVSRYRDRCGPFTESRHRFRLQARHGGRSTQCARSGVGGLSRTRSLDGHSAAWPGRRFFVAHFGAAVCGVVSGCD
jgi:starch synthase